MRAYGNYVRVVDVSEIERVRAANEWDFWYLVEWLRSNPLSKEAAKTFTRREMWHENSLTTVAFDWTYHFPHLWKILLFAVWMARTHLQRAKERRVTNNPGLVNFAIGLSDLPTGKWSFFKGNYLNYRYSNQSFSSISLFFRSTWQDFWATSTCLLQLAPMASCKTDLFA